MKIFIAFLLIFSSFNDGKVSGQTTNNTSTMTPSTIGPTSSSTTEPTSSSSTAEPTTSTTTSTTVAPSTTSTSNTQTTTISSSTASPTTTTVTPSPTANVGVNVTWTFSSTTNITNVVMVITNLKASQWAAIGLGQTQAMIEAHVFICQRNADDTIGINRYINYDYDGPEAAGSEQGGVFKALPSQFTNGVIICQFTLSNFTTQPFEQVGDLRPLSQSGSYHPLFAIGPLGSGGDIQQHNSDSRVGLDNTVQLNQNEIILYKVSNPPQDNSINYFQVHGFIMVFAWIFFASTGVLLSRYFKKSWPKNSVCGKPVWYSGHRFLMSIAVVLTVLGFLFILVALKGTWVGVHEEKKHFIHSVTGALVIGFAFFQPFLALFRCDPDSRYRYIFNVLHALVGFSAFSLSIVTLFLATYFGLFKDNKSRLVMIVWTIWIVLIFTLFEVIQHYIRTKYGEILYGNINAANKTSDDLVEIQTSLTVTSSLITSQQETRSEDKIKNILLATHILIAAILSIYFTTLIV